MSNKISIIILAAGKGTRMNSAMPKVLHKINNKSMLEHVISKTNNLNPKKIIVVIGYKAEEVKKHLREHQLDYALQIEQKGTAHAVMQCEEKLSDFNGDTLILSGDVPLIKSQTLTDLYDAHIDHNAQATILSAKIENPYGYGRIIREKNQFSSIIEEKDATQNQKNINEINAGIYIFNNKVLFENINKINNQNKQSEYYLPDIMPIIMKNNGKVFVHPIKDEYEIKGANTLEQLTELEEYAKKTEKTDKN